MGILEDKLAINGSNIETVILSDLTLLNTEDENTLSVETLEGKKRVFIDNETGDAYIIFNKVRYNLRDYKSMTFKEFLEKLG